MTIFCQQRMVFSFSRPLQLAWRGDAVYTIFNFESGVVYLTAEDFWDTL